MELRDHEQVACSKVPYWASDQLHAIPDPNSRDLPDLSAVADSCSCQLEPVVAPARVAALLEDLCPHIAEVLLSRRYVHCRPARQDSSELERCRDFERAESEPGVATADPYRDRIDPRMDPNPDPARSALEHVRVLAVQKDI